MNAYPQLESVWPTGTDFLEHHHGGDQGELTFLHPVADASQVPSIAVGDVVRIALYFTDRGADFRLHARVVERLTDTAPFGLRLAFLDEERDRKELVLAFAEGESIPYLRRKAVRTPCDLGVDVTRADGSVVKARLSNVSERGAQLEGSGLCTDERVDLDIAMPEGKLRVHARVTSILAGLAPGAGLEFLFTSVKQRENVAAEVTRFRKR